VTPVSGSYIASEPNLSGIIRAKECVLQALLVKNLLSANVAVSHVQKTANLGDIVFYEE
jgi:hypothetical protein